MAATNSNIPNLEPFCCRKSTILKIATIIIGILDLLWFIYINEDEIVSLILGKNMSLINGLCYVCSFGSFTAFFVGIATKKYTLMEGVIIYQVLSLCLYICFTVACLMAAVNPKGYCGEYIGNNFSINKGHLLSAFEIQKIAVRVTIGFGILSLIYALFVHTIYKYYVHLRDHQLPHLSFDLSLEAGPKAVAI